MPEKMDVEDKAAGIFVAPLSSTPASAENGVTGSQTQLSASGILRHGMVAGENANSGGMRRKEWMMVFPQGQAHSTRGIQTVWGKQCDHSQGEPQCNLKCKFYASVSEQ